jgi:hypothetical protein
VQVLDGVVVEGRQDDALLAIDLAAGQGDAVLAPMDQRLGDREGIGQDVQATVPQEIHHGEGRAAAVDDDRLAVGHQPGGHRRDGALLVGVLDPLRVERRRAEGGGRSPLRRRDAAVDAPDQPVLLQTGEVATQRGARHACQADEFANGNHGPVGHGSQYSEPAILLVHTGNPKQFDQDQCTYAHEGQQR